MTAQMSKQMTAQSPLRLLFVCSEYPPAPHGGIGVVVKTLGQQLTQLGHTVLVVGYDPTVSQDTWTEDGAVRVLRLAPKSNRELRIGRYHLRLNWITERRYLSRQVAQVAQAEAVDLVESYDWGGPLWPFGEAPFHPLLVRMHGANSAYAYDEGKRQSRFIRFFERRNVMMADQLVAVSRHMGLVTLAALGLQNRDFSVVYNGIDTNRFTMQAMPREDALVLFVGRIHPRKGINELLAAWPWVVEAVPGATLALVGALPNETMQQALLATVPAAQRDGVRFVGRVSHETLPSWYARATVAVFPSRTEAFGLTCAEAMACGTPVVMTRRASGPELVTDGVSGLLVEPTETRAFADAIIRLLSDAELCETLGQQAAAAARTRFDLADLAEKNLVIYRATLAQQKGMGR